jgi:hypothetical protein
MRQEFEKDAKSIAEAEETLRLVAQQPVPEGLEERVHARLGRARIALADEPDRRGFWHLWLPARRVQFAGAAVLAGVIAVSMLSVRHPSGKAPAVSSPVAVPSRPFGTAVAQGHPASLKPIPVPAVQGKKKKPSAARSAKRASKSQTTAAQSETAKP